MLSRSFGKGATSKLSESCVRVRAWHVFFWGGVCVPHDAFLHAATLQTFQSHMQVFIAHTVS